MSFLKRLFGKPDPVAQSDLLWDQVYDARSVAYEAGFGKLPQDIQKLGNLFGVWPGGGLFVIPVPQLRAGHAIYTSFGLTNPDMPSTLTIRESAPENADGDTRRYTLAPKETPTPARPWPGYGYEIIVAADDREQWPLWLLQWAVQAEILNDAGLRDRVEANGGLTVEDVQIGDTLSLDLLITKAQPPLMTQFSLPTGTAEVLVMTVITRAEMQWSRKHGRAALLASLQQAGVGQFSTLDRDFVIAMPEVALHRVLSLATQGTAPPEFQAITSRDLALAQVELGSLEQILSFPEQFGGADLAANQLFVPVGIGALKDEVTQELDDAAEIGLIDQLDVQHEYKGDSFIPSKIHMTATHSGNDGRIVRTIDIW